MTKPEQGKRQAKHVLGEMQEHIQQATELAVEGAQLAHSEGVEKTKTFYEKALDDVVKTLRISHAVHTVADIAFLVFLQTGKHDLLNPQIFMTAALGTLVLGTLIALNEGRVENSDRGKAVTPGEGMASNMMGAIDESLLHFIIQLSMFGLLNNKVMAVAPAVLPLEVIRYVVYRLGKFSNATILH